VIKFTPDGTALINQTLVCWLQPPLPTLQCCSTMTGAPHCQLALLGLDVLSSISVHSPLMLFQHSSTGIVTPYSALLSLVLLSFILCSSAWNGIFSVPTGTSLLVEHYTIPTAAPVSGLILCYVILHTRPPPFGIPQSPFAHWRFDMALLFFILRSINIMCALLVYT